MLKNDHLYFNGKIFHTLIEKGKKKIFAYHILTEKVPYSKEKEKMHILPYFMSFQNLYNKL